MAKPGAVVFVHGIFGGEKTWSSLLPELNKDRFVERFFDLRLFNYSSPKARFNPLKRIPDFGDVASRLATAIKQDPSLNERSCMVLVGHSQGGLIIQRLLVDAVRAGRASEDLCRIRGVVLLATPNAGSELFLSTRRALERLWIHPQERSLRPFNDQVAEMHEVLLKNVVYAQRASLVTRPIRFDVYAGDEDGVVPAHSARSLFPNAGTLPGDHSSILCPSGPQALVVGALADACRRALNAPEPDATVVCSEMLDPHKKSDVQDAEALLGDNFLSDQNVSPEDFRYWLAHYDETFDLALRVIVARLDGRIEGVLMFHESVVDSLIVVDYVACRTEPAVHGLLFRKLLDQLRSRARSAGITSIVFEIEDPEALAGREADRARARLRRFRSLGARSVSGVRYVAPEMDNFGVPGAEIGYLLMHAATGLQPASLPSARVRQIVKFLYTVWYRNWFSRRFAGRETELQAYVDDLYQRVAGAGVTLPANCQLEGGPQGTAADR